MRKKPREHRVRVCSTNEEFPLATAKGFLAYFATGGAVTEVIAYLERLERYWGRPELQLDPAQARLRDLATCLRAQFSLPATSKFVNSIGRAVGECDQSLAALNRYISLVEASALGAVQALHQCFEMLGPSIKKIRGGLYPRDRSIFESKIRRIEEELVPLAQTNALVSRMESVELFISRAASDIHWCIDALAASEPRLSNVNREARAAVRIGVVPSGQYAEFLAPLSRARTLYADIASSVRLHREHAAFKDKERAYLKLQDLSGLPTELAQWYLGRWSPNGNAMRAKAGLRRSSGPSHL